MTEGPIEGRGKCNFKKKSCHANFPKQHRDEEPVDLLVLFHSPAVVKRNSRQDLPPTPYVLNSSPSTFSNKMSSILLCTSDHYLKGGGFPCMPDSETMTTTCQALRCIQNILILSVIENPLHHSQDI